MFKLHTALRIVVKFKTNNYFRTFQNHPGSHAISRNFQDQDDFRWLFASSKVQEKIASVLSEARVSNLSPSSALSSSSSADKVVSSSSSRCWPRRSSWSVESSSLLCGESYGPRSGLSRTGRDQTRFMACRLDRGRTTPSAPLSASSPGATASPPAPPPPAAAAAAFRCFCSHQPLTCYTDTLALKHKVK